MTVVYQRLSDMETIMVFKIGDSKDIVIYCNGKYEKTTI